MAKQNPVKKANRITLRDGLLQVFDELMKKKITPQQSAAAVKIANSTWKGELTALAYYNARKERPPRFVFLDVSTQGGA